MNSHHWLWIPLFVVTLLPLGCGRSSQSAKDKLYDIKGKVTALDVAKKKVTLDHEDIPGLMITELQPR